MKLDAHKVSSLKMRLTAALTSLDAARGMIHTRDQVEALEDVERSIMLAVEENGELLEGLYEENGDLKPDDVSTGAVSDAIKRADAFHAPILPVAQRVAQGSRGLTNAEIKAKHRKGK